MSTEPQHCYLDESGNHGFNFAKKGTSTHFVVGGAIVDNTIVSELDKQIEKVAQIHFSGSEIRSKNVGPDDDRRLRILSDILPLDFHIYCLVVDKTKLNGKGLKYKKSFYKYLNRIAYDELYQTFPRIKLFADEIGDKEFMDGFVKYVENKCLNKDMFGYSTFGFRPSTPNRLVQLADFLVGTIARCYDQQTLSPRAGKIMAMLFRSKKLLPIKEWPKLDIRFATPPTELQLSRFDQAVKDQNLRLAMRFLDESKKNKDSFIREQVATLEFLVFDVTHGNPPRYVSTKEILDHLRVFPDLRANKKMLGRAVIDKLRDAGVMIAGSPRGYKFAISTRDLDQFVSYSDSFIRPMLKRLKTYRNKILTSTKNGLDIIGSDKYAYLRDFFDTKR